MDPELGPLEAVNHPVVVVVGTSALRTAANPAAARLFGFRFRAGDVKPLEQLVGVDAAATLCEFLRAPPHHGVGASLRLQCITPAGERSLSVDVARTPGKANSFVLTLRAETPLTGMEALAQARATLDSLPVGIELYDRHFNALFYNKKSDDLFDYSDRSVNNHEDWWELAFPDAKRRKAARAEWRVITANAARDPGRAYMAEWEVTCRDGLSRSIQFYYRLADQGFSLVLWDVTDQRRLESELREIARTDSLTGLANRRSFFERAQTMLADRRAAKPLTVLMLDLDHFKTVNDTFGHSVGDEVLTAVSRRAQVALRKDDLLARMGGEEFAVLLPGTGPAQAAAIAQRLRRAVMAKPVMADLTVTVSVGSASRRPGEIEIDAMVARADVALYAAKTAGRNCVVSAETMERR